jgi:hypothetical protein
MSISVGDPVELAVDRVSTAGGASTFMPQATKGRVCRDYGTGTYCVRLERLGCRRLSVVSISPSSEPAPLCDSACTERC